MSARDVIEKVLEIRCDGYDRNTADAIISTLKGAGYTPPMRTGAIHRALQDAFQAGVNEAFAGRYIRPSSDLVALKHKICDGILTDLTSSKEAVLGGNACHSTEHAVPETTSKGEQRD